MKLDEQSLLYARLIPPVSKLELISQETLLLDEGVPFTVHGGSDELVLPLARQYWNITPALTCLPPAEIASEAYEIETSAAGVTIKAASPAGVRHALRTLRQLAEAERGADSTPHSILPYVRIQDAPDLDFRAIGFYWFPETPIWEIEKHIRMAAYYKFNYVTIESWGVFKFDSFPEFGWPEYAVPKSEVRRLVKLGRELGVTLFPQMNLFGHATSARSITGKHALLDFHPEFASLFESDGWTWCLSNPNVRRRLTALVEELHELYGNPPYFLIGCDEAYNAGCCTLCRRSDYRILLLDHLKYFHDLLKSRGARPIMWHDMLLASDDPRWQGYTAFGKSEDGMDTLYRDLPRDIIIGVWEYEYPVINGQPPTWPTVRFFKDEGFDVLVTPWLNQAGTASLGQLAHDEKLMGLLMGSCHKNHGNGTYVIYYNGSRAGWGASRPEYRIQYREFLNRHMREVGHDMGITQYIQAGNTQFQINPYEFPLV